MTTSTTEAKRLVGEIKLLCELADGWEDGETFYVDTINSIRDLVAEQPTPAVALDTLQGAMDELYAAEFLYRYNRWRCGDDSYDMPDPAELDVALDMAVKALRRAQPDNQSHAAACDDIEKE